MSDKNFKVKNGIDAVGPITISPSSNSIDGIVINTPVGGKAIRFIRVGTGEVGSIDEWGTLVVSGGIQIVQPWYVRTPGLEAQSHFWTADYRSAAGFGGTSTGTNPVIYISSWGGGTNDLTQWITPNNTILAKVDYLGNITARDLTLSGNLTVNGTTTNLNSTNLVIEDKNIIIADVATPTDTTADGAGITIKGATDKTFNWIQSTGRFTSSEPVQASAFVSTYIYASQIGSTVIGTATLNTNSDTGGLLINTAGAANKGLILRSAASPTANLQEWQRSDGTYDLAFNNGASSLNKLVFTDARAWGIYWGAEPLLSTSTGYLIVSSWGSERPGFVVKARPGQSNALQIWQDSSGGTKSYVDQDGVIYASSGLITGAAAAHIGAYRPNIKLNINNTYAGDNPLSIKGAASQTSDYLYIANSAGSFVASISSSGQFISAAKTLNLDSGNLSFGYGGGANSGNLAIGTYALNSNTTGGVNLALGAYALQNNTTGGYNVAIGTGSLYYNISGAGNTAIGSVALQNNLTNDQTAIGIGSLFSATTGYANTALGSSALNKVTTGVLNIAFGRLSGYKLTSGNANTIVGSYAMYNGEEVSTGSNNTVIGYESGAANLGSGNVFIGFQSAKNETGSNKLYIANSSTSTPLIGGDFSASTIALNGTTTFTSTGGANIANFFNGTNGYGAGAITSTGTFNINAANMGFPYTSTGATLNVNAGAANIIPLTVRGVTSQTSDLQQWQNSSGTMLAKIDKDGNFSNSATWGSIATTSLSAISGNITSTYGLYNNLLASTNAGIAVKPWAADIPGAIVRGYASQSANLQEWQNSAGSILSSVSAAGLIRVNNTNTDAMITATGNSTYDAFRFRNAGGLFLWGGGSNNNIYFASTGTFALTGGNWVSGRLAVDTGSTGTVGIIVRGQASQTANLQEWQDSAGTVIAYINSEGSIYSANRIVSPGDFEARSNSFFGNPSFSGATVNITTRATTQIGAIIRGISGQTANLQEWQDSSGTVLANMEAGGFLRLTREARIAQTNSGEKLLVLRGASSQTANLQEWQDSAANVWAHVGLSGSRFGAIGSQGATFIDQYGNLTVRSNSTVFGNSIVSIGTAGSTSTGITVRGVTSQSASLQEWQDSTGLVLSKVDSAGRWYGTDGVFSLGVAVGATGSPGPNLYVKSRYASQIASAIRGFASQTANLQEWQDSAGTALGAFNAYGSLYVSNNIEGGTAQFGNTGYASASQIVLKIKGSASQTANLQEWQNSSGTVLTSVDKDGYLQTPRLVITNGGNITDSAGTTPYFGFGSNQIAIYARNASYKPLIIQGAASQTANLQEWQDSSGGALALINSSGAIVTGGTVRATVGGIFGGTTKLSTSLTVYTSSASNIGQIIQGSASQTANLQEWQNSAGTVVANIYPNGTAGLYGLEVFTGGAGITGNYGNTDTLQVRINGAARRGILVKGAASQTANLQEWQDSAGTVLAKVDALGNFTATSKSFDIIHPTKENMRLRYGSLEGPENGVYIRGTAESNIIELPDYWTGLVHEDSITVSLTSVGSAQNIYVEKIENNKIYIGGNLEKAFFTVYGERKDIDKLTVEY